MKDNEEKNSLTDTVKAVISKEKVQERFSFKEFLNDLRMEQQETM